MDENKVELLENTEKQETNLPVPVENTEKPIEDKKPKKKGGRRKTDKPTEEVTDFEQLALLMNSTVEELKDEFFLFQIRKLMSKMAKTIVRFGVSDGNLAKIFQNAKTTGLDSVVVAPTYLSACEKQVDKIDGYKVGSILDFPFGESALKSKITGIADCRRWDVDEVTVMMPSAMLTKENKRLFKKQVFKLGKKYRGHVGIGLNATDLSEEKIEKPDLSLYEEFYTDTLRIESPLHGSPSVFDIESDKLICELKEDGYLTYITQVGNYIIAQYVTVDNYYYGVLMNDKCETLAILPHLTDVYNEELYFDYSSGNVRKSNIYCLDELKNLAQKELRGGN